MPPITNEMSSLLLAIFGTTILCNSLSWFLQYLLVDENTSFCKNCQRPKKHLNIDKRKKKKKRGIYQGLTGMWVMSTLDVGRNNSCKIEIFTLAMSLKQLQKRKKLGSFT